MIKVGRHTFVSMAYHLSSTELGILNIIKLIFTGTRELHTRFRPFLDIS